MDAMTVQNTPIYDRYKAGMKSLLAARSVAASDDNMETVFCHLSPEEREKERKKAEEKQSFIATPSLMIAKAYHVVKFGPSLKDSLPSLEYVCCFQAGCYGAGNILWTERANNFARHHWKDKFFPKEKYVFVLGITLRYFGGSSGGVKAIWLLINEVPELIFGSTKIPVGEAIDKATAYRTINPLKAKEAGAGRLARQVFNCAVCGAAIQDNGCDICKDQDLSCVPDARIGRLSPAVIDYLKNKGHIVRKEM